eukprot:Opistho-2@51192
MSSTASISQHRSSATERCARPAFLTPCVLRREWSPMRSKRRGFLSTFSRKRVPSTLWICGSIGIRSQIPSGVTMSFPKFTTERTLLISLIPKSHCALRSLTTRKRSALRGANTSPIMSLTMTRCANSMRLRRRSRRRRHLLCKRAAIRRGRTAPQCPGRPLRLLAANSTRAWLRLGSTQSTVPLTPTTSGVAAAVLLHASGSATKALPTLTPWRLTGRVMLRLRPRPRRRSAVQARASQGHAAPVQARTGQSRSSLAMCRVSGTTGKLQTRRTSSERHSVHPIWMRVRASRTGRSRRRCRSICLPASAREARQPVAKATCVAPHPAFTYSTRVVAVAVVVADDEYCFDLLHSHLRFTCMPYFFSLLPCNPKGFRAIAHKCVFARSPLFLSLSLWIHAVYLGRRTLLAALMLAFCVCLYVLLSACVSGVRICYVAAFASVSVPRRSCLGTTLC